jgi:drug/metabolite transporter (DMT)-like permease
MVAFASNSIICRLALRDEAIDPASFTSIRLGSGALTLLVVFFIKSHGSSPRSHGSWASAISLFFYAICFSYAYVSLDAGTGALILFGCVQGTMIAAGLWLGDRPAPIEWLGWVIALAGLVWLLLPGAAAPSVAGAGLMALAGIAWGVYSIRGRAESNAVGANASNFSLSLLLVAILTALAFSSAKISTTGILLALLSGTITSGLGYVIWYVALDHLSAMQAALVQLSVPAIALAGGAILLAEPLTLRVTLASALVLGGIAIALIRKRKIT